MNRKEIENILKDYHWMINSIKIMRESLKDTGEELTDLAAPKCKASFRQSLNHVGEGLTAQYGIEAVMPKAKGTTGDPIYREYLRREKRWKKIREYEEKIMAIQSLFHRVHDERESEILYWLLEGKSYRWIAEHMGLSSSHVRRLRESLINRLANGTNGTNGTKGTNDTKLQEEKSAC